MTRNLTHLHKEDLHHSHSTLNRLLEEIESHAMTLDTEVEDRVSILEELQQYVAQFGEEVKNHMAEEEQDLFGSLARDLPAGYQGQVDRLFHDHRELEVLLEELIVAVEISTERPFNDALVRAVNSQTRLLKYAFVAHTNRERLLIERVQTTEP